MVSSHLKNIRQNGNLPQNRGENNNCLKPPARHRLPKNARKGKAWPVARLGPYTGRQTQGRRIQRSASLVVAGNHPSGLGKKTLLSFSCHCWGGATSRYHSLRSNILNRRYIFNWLFFHVHLRFRGCSSKNQPLDLKSHQ